ncbi:MAG: hypothetical protein WBM65_14285 [Sedimenticolaceae bacterium]
MNTWSVMHVAVRLLTLCLSTAAMATAPESLFAPESPYDGQTTCNLASGEAPLVSLHWLEQPQTGDVEELRRFQVTLVASNNTRSWQLARVTVTPFGNQRRATMRPRWLWLPPGRQWYLPVTTASVGIDALSLQSSAALRAHVQVLDWTAEKTRWYELDQSLSPKLYLHGERSADDKAARLLVYDNTAKIKLFAGGDFRHRYTELVRHDLAAIQPTESPLSLNSVSVTHGTPPQFDGVFGAPGSDYTFCVRIPFDTQDSGVAEDFYTGAGTQWVPASYARVTITNFNSGDDSLVLKDAYLDVDGCIDFDHTPNSDVWGVIVLSEADVPTTNSPNTSNRLAALDSGGNLSTWYFVGELDNNQDDFVFDLDGDSRSNLFFASVFSLMRFSDGVAGETIYAMDAACPTASDNSCNSSFTTIENDVIPVAYIHPDHNDHKFAISHEIGHAVVHRYMGGVHPGKNNMYLLNEGAPECSFQAGDAHALHSVEWSSSALTEGFAQFYATAVWNDTFESDGAFHYYKDDYKGGAVQDVDIADGPLGGQDAYLRNVCPGDDASKSGKGVELDWARQLWDFRSLPGLAPTNVELLEQFRLAVQPPNFPNWQNANSWQRMFDGIQQFDMDNGTDFTSRWDATDDANGIDY